MPKIYRAMKESNGKPLLGENASALGVRVPADVCPDVDNNVHPQTGGMSVSPSVYDLPLHRIPRRLQHLVSEARGVDLNVVWSMGKGPFEEGVVAVNLRLRPDPNNNGHGFVEPDAMMSLAAYQNALAATQNMWSIDESGES